MWNGALPVLPFSLDSCCRAPRRGPPGASGSDHSPCQWQAVAPRNYQIRVLSVQDDECLAGRWSGSRRHVSPSALCLKGGRWLSGPCKDIHAVEFEADVKRACRVNRQTFSVNDLRLGEGRIQAPHFPTVQAVVFYFAASGQRAYPTANSWCRLRCGNFGDTPAKAAERAPGRRPPDPGFVKQFPIAIGLQQRDLTGENWFTAVEVCFLGNAQPVLATASQGKREVEFSI